MKKEIIAELLQQFEAASKVIKEVDCWSARELQVILGYSRGENFAVIRSKGDQALFGGFTTADMKKKLGVPETRALADFLPTLTIKAKDFATELTSHNVLERQLKDEKQIAGEHIDNNIAVRDMLKQRGVKPEELPAEEDLAKVKRKLQADEKKY